MNPSEFMARPLFLRLCGRHRRTVESKERVRPFLDGIMVIFYTPAELQRLLPDGEEPALVRPLVTGRRALGMLLTLMSARHVHKLWREPRRRVDPRGFVSAVSGFVR
uniref:hypothetical protein n=1 Tax=Streptomyces sp. DG1A-41 TaxID=3125779 RepID=UPI0040401EF2